MVGGLIFVFSCNSLQIGRGESFGAVIEIRSTLYLELCIRRTQWCIFFASQSVCRNRVAGERTNYFSSFPPDEILSVRKQVRRHEHDCRVIYLQVLLLDEFHRLKV